MRRRRPVRERARPAAHRGDRPRPEAGSALVEVTWLGLLLLVPLVYLLLAVFEVQRAAYGVSGAARAAGRAYVLAPAESVALGRARAAAAVTLRDHHVAVEEVDLDVTCRPDPGNCLAPGAVVRVRLAYQVPAPLVPAALGGQRPSVRVEAEHTVPYGTFRADR